MLSWLTQTDTQTNRFCLVVLLAQPDELKTTKKQIRQLSKDVCFREEALKYLCLIFRSLGHSNSTAYMCVTALETLEKAVVYCIIDACKLWQLDNETDLIVVGGQPVVGRFR